jgi:hypothetical protein
VGALSASLILEVVDPARIDQGEGPTDLGPLIGLAGFTCGVIFGSLLFVAERGKTILELPLTRVAIWGVLVSGALPFLMGKGVPEMLVAVPVGAVSAMVSVAVVRARVRGRAKLAV